MHAKTNSSTFGGATSFTVGASIPRSGWAPVLPAVSTLTTSGSVAGSLAPNRNDEPAARILAAIVALQSSLDSASTLAEAGQRVASQVSAHLDTKKVIVLWRAHPERNLQVIGDTEGLASSRDTLPWILAAAEEAIARGGVTRWPSHELSNRHALLAVGKLGEHLQSDSLLAAALTDNEGVRRGVLMVCDSFDEMDVAFNRVAADPLGCALARIARSQPSPLESAVRDLTELLRGRNRQWMAALTTITILVMLLPIRYRVTAPLELQPRTRRFIAVPFDGPLQSVSVKPGDVVAEGELLASINPRELEFQLAGSIAEWNRAEQERKTLMSKHDFAATKLAELDAERLRLKTELLQHQRMNMEVRSPIAGMVVSGDLSQKEGMPMTRGQTLLEIAPLGIMVVEIAVPENEVAEVRPGMSVEFFVNSSPSRRITGAINRLHPRAELRDHENVFIAEVHLDDPEGRYRPGMRGRATIIGDRHPLVWNQFHHAFTAVRQWIGW